MVYDVDMLSNNNKINAKMKSLNNLFKNNGWKLDNNNNKLSDNIIYYRPGHETEFFKFEFFIDLNNTNIYVSVPLKNSEFQYKTKFNNYFSAIKYAENKFNYFINSENIENIENISF